MTAAHLGTQNAADSEQLALKILANATSYGVFIELNVLPCEDTLKEMKRRLYGILQFYKASWGDLGDNIRLVLSAQTASLPC